MPNLDNIFNKFFPQSQTGSKGKFLIRMAWAIEIMVAVIGVCIGLIMIFGSKQIDGEQIQKIADEGEEDKHIKSSFDSLLGLDLVKQLIDDIGLTLLRNSKGETNL